MWEDRRREIRDSPMAATVRLPHLAAAAALVLAFLAAGLLLLGPDRNALEASRPAAASMPRARPASRRTFGPDEKFVVTSGAYGYFSNGYYAAPLLLYLANRLNRTLVLPHWQMTWRIFAPCSSFFDTSHMEKCGLRIAEYDDVEPIFNRTTDHVVHVRDRPVGEKFHDIDFGQLRNWTYANLTKCIVDSNCGDGGYMFLSRGKYAGNGGEMGEQLAQEPYASKRVLVIGSSFLVGAPTPPWRTKPCPWYPYPRYLETARRFIRGLLAPNGEPWIALHIRRGDFKPLPRLDKIIEDVQSLRRSWKADNWTVFVATNGDDDELRQIVAGISRCRFFRPVEAASRRVAKLRILDVDDGDPASVVRNDSAATETPFHIPPADPPLPVSPDPFHPFLVPYFPGPPQWSAHAFLDKIILSHGTYFIGDPRSSFTMSAIEMRGWWDGEWQVKDGTAVKVTLAYPEENNGTKRPRRSWRSSWIDGYLE
ncbi:hypothetical protein DFJ74DRAFT_652023 [Hyaloraphidium curvatum]|nr:hypothetical protein DFJ74DRAFT_652023 [Hyaloraphidium curvatum]